MSPLSSFVSWHDRKIGRALILLLFLWTVPVGVCSAQDSVNSDPVILEEVNFLLFGRERQEVGEVQLQGQKYRIRLFDARISTYYSVTISAEDLISTTPISADRSLRILRERAVLIAARESLREKRRKERRDQALAKSARSEPRSRGNKPNTNARTHDPSPASGGSISLKEAVPTRSSLEQGKEILLRLNQVCEELLQRSVGLLRVGHDCQEFLRSWNAASDGNSRLFAKLREESYSLVEKTESIGDQIRVRMKEIDWTIAQVKSRDLRARDLPELADRIRRRVLQCEQRVDSLEVLLSACADGLKVLGDPIVARSELEAQPVSRTAVTREPSRPAHSSARSVPEAVDEDQVTVVTSTARKLPGKPDSSVRNETRSAVETKNVVDEIERVAVSEAEPETQPESESSPTSGGFQTLILGGILGALLVLLLAKVLKSLS